MDIVPLGDSALLIRLPDDFAAAPGKTLSSVLHAVHRLQDAALPGVVDLVPGYTSIAVFFDIVCAVKAGAPCGTVFDWLTAKILQKLAAQKIERNVSALRAPVIEIPVCYEGEFALDLEELAREKKLPMVEVVRRHSAPTYLVHCLGFTPGFPYLSGLPPELATPRRAEPRTKVPAGSVAIGGSQTGIYPQQSPGGWHIIGRTPLRLFDPTVQPAALLRPGDRVRFHSVTRAKYDSLGK